MIKELNKQNNKKIEKRGGGIWFQKVSLLYNRHTHTHKKGETKKKNQIKHELKKNFKKEEAWCRARCKSTRVTIRLAHLTFHINEYIPIIWFDYFVVFILIFFF